MRPPRVVKAVKFHYKPTPEKRELLQAFRVVVNHAIHICPEEGIKGRLRLRDRVCREFKERC